MFRFEGQSKGAQLGPYRYHADGIIYFGQWRVFRYVFRMVLLMEKELFIFQMVQYLKEDLLMGKALEKGD
jgi:hypothetical protein